MNSMIRTSYSQKNEGVMKKFLSFAEDIRRSGKNPQSMIDELIASGKVTHEQYEQARRLAMNIMNKK